MKYTETELSEAELMDLLDSFVLQNTAKPLSPNIMLRISQMTSLDELTEDELRTFNENPTAIRAIALRLEELENTSSVSDISNIVGLLIVAGFTDEAANADSYDKKTLAAADDGKQNESISITVKPELNNKPYELKLDIMPLTEEDKEELGDCSYVSVNLVDIKDQSILGRSVKFSINRDGIEVTTFTLTIGGGMKLISNALLPMINSDFKPDIE